MYTVYRVIPFFFPRLGLAWFPVESRVLLGLMQTTVVCSHVQKNSLQFWLGSFALPHVIRVLVLHVRITWCLYTSISMVIGVLPLLLCFIELSAHGRQRFHLSPHHVPSRRTAPHRTVTGLWTLISWLRFWPSSAQAAGEASGARSTRPFRPPATTASAAYTLPTPTTSFRSPCRLRHTRKTTATLVADKSSSSISTTSHNPCSSSCSCSSTTTTTSTCGRTAERAACRPRPACFRWSRSKEPPPMPSATTRPPAAGLHRETQRLRRLRQRRQRRWRRQRQRQRQRR